MRRLSCRNRVRQIYRCVIDRVVSELDDNDLCQSAVVFSPHPDDETLGCGGTIIRKRKAGADLKIIFMTDGSRSHRHLISESKLKFIRAREALAAARVLGVETENVLFLGFQDQKLNEAQETATRKVADILASQQAEQIFIPYRKEMPGDHFTTSRIVLSALHACKKRPTIYEYPIWFWCHWPWAIEPISSRREILTVVKDSVVSGWGFLRNFRSSVYIGDVLQVKRAALEQYKSQMTRLIPDPAWLTLKDVANGDFLQCFFQEQEVFCRYVLHEASKRT